MIIKNIDYLNLNKNQLHNYCCWKIWIVTGSVHSLYYKARYMWHCLRNKPFQKSWIYTLTTSYWMSHLLPNYTLIAFDERVTFWLQLVRSVTCACAYAALFARRLAYNHYAIAHTCNAANAHAQGSDPVVEAKQLLSRWRQSEYSCCWVGLLHLKSITPCGRFTKFFQREC